MTVFDLAKAGKNGENLLNPDGEVVAAPQDLGVTPTLFGNK